MIGNYTSNDKPCPRGEILLGGGNIVQGYHKMPEKTKEDFTDIDGTWYFCSGDIGQIDPDGCLRVIGRYPELSGVSGVRSEIKNTCHMKKLQYKSLNSFSLGKFGVKKSRKVNIIRHQ